jgi:hypothetical protein
VSNTLSYLTAQSQELGLEALDFGVDKLHDFAYDGLGKTYSKTKGRLDHRRKGASNQPDPPPPNRRALSESRGGRNSRRDNMYGDRGGYGDDYDRRDRGRGDEQYGEDRYRPSV